MRFSDWNLICWAFGSIVAVSIWGGIAMLGQRRHAGEAVYQGLSAFGNCGLTLGPVPGPDRAQCLLVLLPLAMLGGLGLPVLMEIYDWLIKGLALSRHSRVAITWSAGIVLVSMVMLLLVQWPGIETTWVAWRYALADSAQLSVNARSAGLPFSSVSQLPQAATFVLALAMLTGACPAGTGGGLKVTTLHVLARGTRDTLAGRPAGRRFGIALVWLAFYTGMLTLATIGLLLSEPDLHLERTFFMAASALGNVGLSHNPVVVSRPGLYILSATMLVGRIAPVMILWYTLDTAPDADVAM